MISFLIDGSNFQDAADNKKELPGNMAGPQQDFIRFYFSNRKGIADERLISFGNRSDCLQKRLAREQRVISCHVYPVSSSLRLGEIVDAN
jgi:hypothetical protein